MNGNIFNGGPQYFESERLAHIKSELRKSDVTRSMIGVDFEDTGIGISNDNQPNSGSTSNGPNTMCVMAWREKMNNGFFNLKMHWRCE